MSQRIWVFNMAKKRKAQDVYDMKLHESFWFPDCQKTVTRVPGGWIYQEWLEATETLIDSGVFVPYDNDLQPRQRRK
jgi:hypothetical protein